MPWTNPILAALAVGALVVGALAIAAVRLARARFRRQVEADVARLRAASEASAPGPDGPVTDADLAPLPAPVRRWLARSGVVGRPRARLVHLSQRGELRTRPGGRWMPVEAEQWFSVEPPGFVWSAHVRVAPAVFLAGEDRFVAGRGHMQIRLLALAPVVDAQGPTLDQGTLVRFLAEIVWFPSAALSERIHWEAVDDRSAQATMTVGDVTASGVFTFDDDGDFRAFRARRYYDRPGGATLEDWRVDRAPDGVEEAAGGLRLATRAAVTWTLADGAFTWYRLRVLDVTHEPA